MSLAIRQTRAMYSMGDPGLFDFVGKAISGIGKVLGGAVKVGIGAAKGFVQGGPLGAVAGGAGAVIGRPQVMPAMIPSIPLQQGGFQTGTGIQVGLGGSGIRIGHFGPGTGMVGAGGGTQAAGPGGACAVGFHIIRKGRNAGACTKNRRMNPLNPRALSRAVRRITGAKRASGLINRISIRSSCGPCAKKKK